MGEEQGGNEGRGRRVVGLIILLIALLAIGAFVLLFLGKGNIGGLGLPPVEIPTSSVTQESTMPSLPPAPTVLGADVVAVYDVPVTWADNSDNEDGFNIYRQRTDVAGDLVKAGSSGKDTTTFLDQDTYCGETYHYTVASFNAAGESPATVCWEITLPPCPKDESLDLQPGPNQGYNFLTGGVSPNSDFYLPPVGQPRSFMADQPGQGGLIDLGDTGDTPLYHVNLPQPPTYERGGVPAVAGHTYAALATDKQSVIVFKITKLGDDAVFNYIVWRPEKAINGQCSGQTTTGTPGATCTCDQAGVLTCSNGVTVQKDPRCEGGPQCQCETINFGAQKIVQLVCTYPDGKISASPAPNICVPRRDCDCELGSDGTLTGNYVCKLSDGTTSSTPNPTLCPQRVCKCDKDITNQNTGDLTCFYSDGHSETIKNVNLLCPLPGQKCGDGKIQGSEQCETGVACTNASDKCDLTTCTCIPPQTFCGDGVIQPGEACEPGSVKCANNADICTASCTCVPQQDCTQVAGATCTVPGAACTTANGPGVCGSDCRCVPQNNCANDPNATCTAPGTACTTPNGPGVCGYDCRCVPPPQCRCEVDTQGNNTGMQICGNDPPKSNPDACPNVHCDCYVNPLTGGWDGTMVCSDGSTKPAPPGECAPPVCAGPGKNADCDPVCAPGQTCNADCTCSGRTCSNQVCSGPGADCVLPTTGGAGGKGTCNDRCQCVP